MEQSQKKTETGAPLYDNLRKVVNLIDELRDIGLQQHISLPRIAVLGTQSAGKSSLLESIVGMDFLPRGDGVVTRRPLEMRLVHVPNAQQEKPYAIFDKIPNKKFVDFTEVRDTISKLTDEVAGGSKGIVDSPIILTIYAYSCPDLTLVDLPGITRIPIAGQQQNIEQVTKEMAKRYCGDPRTIILAVIPANADMSTSDALQMAMELDPKGTRTLGVITKVDIMDRGTNAKRMILGEEIALKLGYVGIKGRSKHDIDHNVSVKKGLEEEKQFFASHSIYSTMPPGFLGIETLTQKLTKILFNHIRNYLPEILKEINIKINDCEDRLKDLGTNLPETTKDKMQLLWQLVTQFTENFKNALSGRYDAKLESVIEMEVSGAAHIKAMFAELYGNYVLDDYHATEDYSDHEIEKAMIMYEGESLPGFPSIDSFLYLLQPQLDKLKEPAIGLVTFVYGYMEELALSILSRLFHRFPQILDVMQEIVIKAMQEHREKTRKITDQIIESESSFLYTSDLEYLTRRGNIMRTTDSNDNPTTIHHNKALVNEFRARIDSYFNLVCRNVRDSVPKVIGTFLVRACQDDLKYSLYDAINKHEELMTLLNEPESITLERKTLQKTLETLNKSVRAIKKDPDLSRKIGIAEEEIRQEKPKKPEHTNVHHKPPNLHTQPNHTLQNQPSHNPQQQSTKSPLTPLTQNAQQQPAPVTTQKSQSSWNPFATRN